LGAFARAVYGVDDADIGGERQQRQDDEEREHGDAARRGQTTLRGAVVEVVHGGLDRRHQQCDGGQRRHDASRPTRRTHTQRLRADTTDVKKRSNKN